jgi:hypothetical protein
MEDYRKVRDFVSEKSLKLMSHEDKNHAVTGIAITNYELIKNKEREIYFVPTNMFKAILDRKLYEATKKQAQLFGTGNANDVIEGIYKIETGFVSLSRFAEILRTEQFAYLIEVPNGVVNPNILRIDLFRDLKINSLGGYDFVGGIFHCFKHFSVDGVPLSTSKEINDLVQPKHLIVKIGEAFFGIKNNGVNPIGYVVDMHLNEKYDLRVVFYFESITQVYFLKTAFKIRKASTT